MGTVLIDTYRVRCGDCGFDRKFKVGAGRGDLAAVAEGQAIHALEAAQGCSGVSVQVEIVRRA